jgi:16S rRNA G1207 methylase RsmC
MVTRSVDRTVKVVTLARPRHAASRKPVMLALVLTLHPGHDAVVMARITTAVKRWSRALQQIAELGNTLGRSP